MHKPLPSLSGGLVSLPKHQVHDFSLKQINLASGPFSQSPNQFTFLLRLKPLADSKHCIVNSLTCLRREQLQTCTTDIIVFKLALYAM